MAQGFNRGVAIVDGTVTRQKLSADILQKLDEGGDNLEILSTDIEDGFVRDGYEVPGPSLKENFDGISDKLVEVQSLLTSIRRDWADCSGYVPSLEDEESANISISPIVASSRRMVTVGSEVEIELEVTASGLLTPIELELPFGYVLTEKDKAWNAFKGGKIKIKTKIEKEGDTGGLLIATAKAIKGRKTVNGKLKIQNRAFNRMSKKN